MHAWSQATHARFWNLNHSWEDGWLVSIHPGCSINIFDLLAITSGCDRCCKFLSAYTLAEPTLRYLHILGTLMGINGTDFVVTDKTPLNLLWTQGKLFPDLFFFFFFFVSKGDRGRSLPGLVTLR